MDLITYSYANKVNKRIDKLNFIQDTEPSNPELGAVWYKTDTNQVFKAIPNNGKLIWIDITPSGLGSTRFNEVYTIGTAKDNYNGSKKEIAWVNQNPDLLEVFLNGILLIEGEDYSIDSSTGKVVLSNEAEDEDKIELISFENLSLAGAPRVEDSIVVNSDKTALDGVLLRDQKTGDRYILKINDGNIVLEGVE